jgi:hypothetical protein
MSRTAAVAFPLTLVAAWYLHVVNRAGNGPGMRWDRVAGNASFTATLTGVAYVVFVLAALTVPRTSRERRARSDDARAATLLACPLVAG